MNSIGEFIVQKRKECGMTQKQLAELLHLSSSAISKWELGVAVPHISQFPQIAEALKVSVNELYALTIEEFQYQTSEECMETDKPGTTEESIEKVYTDPPRDPVPEEARSKKKPIITSVCIIALILVAFGTIWYISKFPSKQPSLQIVDDYYSEENEIYGYRNIYYVIVEYKGELTEDFLQSYKDELLLAYSDKFKEASIIIVEFYQVYSDFAANATSDMKLVLLPPRKE